MTEYIYDPSWEKERDRLRGLEHAQDAGTQGLLERLGTASGWRCLEVGGGAGSIAEWLCDRVGDEGSVVATDIDTRFLEMIDRPNLTVLRHDVVNDSPVEGPFDLVHSRAMLAHLPERRRAVVNMAASVRPGGWILIEDVEVGTVGPIEPEPSFDRLLDAIATLMDRVGIDRQCGRKLASMLRDAGVADVRTEGRIKIEKAGTGPARLSVETLGPRAVAAGLLSQEDLDVVRSAMSDPDFEVVSPIMFAAWGRVPG